MSGALPFLESAPHVLNGIAELVMDTPTAAPLGVGGIGLEFLIYAGSAPFLAPELAGLIRCGPQRASLLFLLLDILTATQLHVDTAFFLFRDSLLGTIHSFFVFVLSRLCHKTYSSSV
jgi:hypothetical protein